MLEPHNYTISSKALSLPRHEEENTPIHYNLSKMSDHELTKTHFINIHQDIALTLKDHISIDLIGPYNTTSQSNSYALTAVCSHTGYLVTTPVQDK